MWQVDFSMELQAQVFEMRVLEFSVERAVTRSSGDDEAMVVGEELVREAATLARILCHAAP